MSAFAQPLVMVPRNSRRTAIVGLAVSLPYICSLAVAQERSADLGALEEVTVTAQKRAERLQDVPIAISVLGGGDIDKSTGEGVIEALSRVPGVSSAPAVQGSGTQLTVRGVTAAGALFYGGSPIGYYLDSVPFGFVKSAIAPDSNAYDLDRVEVLRGPQGTLYGASALNGVMRVLTKDPDLEELQFKVRTAGSSTDDGGANYRGDMAVNVPIVEGKLAARAVIGYQELSGWIDKPTEKDFNDSQIRNLRLKVKAAPTEQMSIGVSAWLSRSDIGGPSRGDDDGRNPFVNPEDIDTDYDAYSATLDYDFGSFTVSSATSKLGFQTAGDVDFFGTIVFSALESDVLAEEIVVNSAAGGDWRWSVGGIYREADDRTFQYFTTPEPNAPWVDPREWLDSSRSYAAFGELTRLFNDGKIELTAGLRYFEDDLKSQEGPPGSAPELRVNPKFHATTPRVVLNWHPSDQTTYYASYAEGFRSGFDQFLLAKTVLNFPAVKPDTLKNYELGTKGSTVGGSFSYEGAVYYIDWQDVQQSLSLIVDGIPRAANMNGESASGIGIDLGASLRPVDNLELSAGVSWNDLAFDANVYSAGVLLFAEGSRLNSSPELTANLAADYQFPLGAGGLEGSFSIAANYVSDQDYVTLLGVGRYATVSDDLLTGRASIGVSGSAQWTISLFIDNFTNEDGSPLRGQLGIPEWSVRMRPRTMGLQLEYRL